MSFPFCNANINNDMTPIKEIQTGNIYTAFIAHELLMGIVKQMDGETITLKGRNLNEEDAPSFFSATPDQLMPVPMKWLSPLDLKYKKYWDCHLTIKNKEITYKNLDGGTFFIFVGRDTETCEKYNGGGFGVSDFLNFLRKMGLIEEVDRITGLFIEKFKLE